MDTETSNTLLPGMDIAGLSRASHCLVHLSKTNLRGSERPAISLVSVDIARLSLDAVFFRRSWLTSS